MRLTNPSWKNYNVEKSKNGSQGETLLGCHAKEEEDKVFTYLIFSFKDPHVILF
jgi:hypothetical protein